MSKLTIAEFQKKYHDYAVETEMEAISDALKLNSILIDGQFKPVKIGNMFCLMEATAADFAINELLN